MPRCWKCGSTDLAPLLESWQCNDCASITMMATGRGPAEGRFSNGDSLASECVAYMKANHPEQYRLIADTVAGQPDPGTLPGGDPIPMTDTTEAPPAEPTDTMPPEVPDTPTEAPPAEPEAPAEPAAA